MYTAVRRDEAGECQDRQKGGSDLISKNRSSRPGGIFQKVQ